MWGICPVGCRHQGSFSYWWQNNEAALLICWKGQGRFRDSAGSVWSGPALSQQKALPGGGPLVDTELGQEKLQGSLHRATAGGVCCGPHSSRRGPAVTLSGGKDTRGATPTLYTGQVEEPGAGAASRALTLIPEFRTTVQFPLKSGHVKSKIGA